MLVITTYWGESVDVEPQAVVPRPPGPPHQAVKLAGPKLGLVRGGLGGGLVGGHDEGPVGGHGVVLVGGHAEGPVEGREEAEPGGEGPV